MQVIKRNGEVARNFDRKLSCKLSKAAPDGLIFVDYVKT